MHINNMDISFPHQCFIDNEFVDSSNGNEYDSINPADESVSVSLLNFSICFFSAFKYRVSEKIKRYKSPIHWKIKGMLKFEIIWMRIGQVIRLQNAINVSVHLKWHEIFLNMLYI